MAKVEGVATVKVNGQEAGKELEKLENKAAALRKEIVKIRKAEVIDPKKLKDAQKQLKAVDKEMKNIKNSAFSYQKVLDNLSGASFNDLKKAHKQLSKEVSGLTRGTEEFKKKASDLSNIKKEMKLYRQETFQAGEEMEESGSRFEMFSGKVKAAFQELAMIAAGIGAAIAVLMKFDKMILETSKLQNKVRFQFQATGEEVDRLTVKLMNLSDRLDEDVNETLKAANVFYKEFANEISKTQAIDLITEAAEKGANANGDLLDILKEYPAQLKQVGLTADESLAVITQSVQEGVFSDKGIDTIKEAGIRLREMTPVTQEALEGIGLSSEEITKSLNNGSKTMFEVIQEVSGKLKGMKKDSPAVGAALADIFGGAGEDAGLRYLETLEDINLNLDEIETNVDEATEAQNRLSDAWNETQLQATKGTGVIGKLFVNMKNSLSGVFETINAFSSGDWLTKLKIGVNAAIDTLLVLLKPLNYIIEIATGEDMMQKIKFDIDKESVTNVAKGLKRAKADIEEELTAEEKAAQEERKRLQAEAYKERIAANEELKDALQQMNLELITDERTRAEKEVEIWYNKEKQKIEASKASAELKAQAVEQIEELHKQKLLAIDEDYKNRVLEKFTAVDEFLKNQAAELELARNEEIDRELLRIEEKYAKQLEIIEAELENESILHDEFLAQKNELEMLRDEELKLHKQQREEQFANEVKRVREQYGLNAQEDQFVKELAALDQHLANKILSEEEYIKARDKIYDKSFKAELEQRKQGIQESQILIEAFSNFISESKEAELAEAGDNEEKKKEIMKKYADKEFAVKAAQIVANTALAIMQALAQLGPIAGAIASALIGATGVIQLTNANKERQRIKGLAEGGSFPVTREQDGRSFNAVYGGNKSGLFTKPTVLVAEEGPEYVIPYSGLQNPVISSFVDAMESARMSGSLHDFNYQRAITAGSQVRGFAEGGFTTDTVQTPEQSNAMVVNVLSGIFAELQLTRKEIVNVIKNVRVYVLYDDIQDAMDTMTELQTEVTME